MPTFEIYVVDAFTTARFGGNAAAVVVIPHDKDMDETTMQNVASEVNLPMSAFVKAQSGDQASYKLLWFNPTAKAAFCGHATLAAGHVLLNILKLPATSIKFDSPAGVLNASKGSADEIVLQFPSSPPTVVTEPPSAYRMVLHAFTGLSVADIKTAVFYYAPRANDLVILLDGVDDTKFAALDFAPSADTSQEILALNMRAAVFVARSQRNDTDSIARVFHINNAGFDEDQVTGSAHTIIAPLFSSLFGMQRIRAHQCSRRGGRMLIEMPDSDTVVISGHAVTVIQGNIST
ncbi:hypothetical protein J3B01_004315 [Coemansia erecta]|nr:hypothetical protein J3B01_004315 [Coemansia erecta]